MSYQQDHREYPNETTLQHDGSDYGVYALRAGYNSTLLRAMMLVMAGVGLLCVLPSFILHPVPAEIGTGQVPDLVYVSTEVRLPVPDAAAPDPGPPAGRRPAASPRNNGRIIVTDSAAVTENTVNVLNDPLISDTTAGDGQTISGGSTGTAGIATGTPVVNTGITNALTVDALPEYEGGLKALYGFIASHLRYPEPARLEGVEGMVHLRFVVEKDGSITDIAILNKAGYGLEEEALRVAHLIPAFKRPALSKGQAVRMQYQLPVRFRLY